MIELIMFLLLIVAILAVGYISEKQHDSIKEEIKKLNELEQEVKELKEELEKDILEKPHYSDDKNIQKKFEFAVKYSGIGRVLSAMCKEFNDESLKRFIEKYFEDNKLWTDYMEY